MLLCEKLKDVREPQMHKYKDWCFPQRLKTLKLTYFHIKKILNVSNHDLNQQQKTASERVKNQSPPKKSNICDVTKPIRARWRGRASRCTSWRGSRRGVGARRCWGRARSDLASAAARRWPRARSSTTRCSPPPCTSQSRKTTASRPPCTPAIEFVYGFEIGDFI